MIEYEEGYAPESSINDNPDLNFVFGEGVSYGSELFIKKSTGKTTGWIGYTLSWTKRQFDDINLGEEYFAKYDRRHDLSVIVSHEPDPAWNFSTVFVFGSGNAITLPVARYIIDGIVVNEYGKRNSYRMVPYHRLDLAATFCPTKIKKKKDATDKKRAKWLKNYESSWTFSIYNVYNRYNPYFIYIDTSGKFEDGNLKVQAKQVSLFPMLPSVTWNFKF